jgi:hypothetical protein
VRGRPGRAPAGASLSFASPKESKQRKGEPDAPPLRCAPGSAALLGPGGVWLNSLRSDNASPDPPGPARLAGAYGRGIGNRARERHDRPEPPAAVRRVNQVGNKDAKGPRGCPPPAVEAGLSSAAAGGQGLALSERSEFSQTPPDASSARHPEAQRRGPDVGSPFFCLLFFGEAKKSKAAAGARPGLQRTSKAPQKHQKDSKQLPSDDG